jgi:hypothetical protein
MRTALLAMCLVLAAALIAPVSAAAQDGAAAPDLSEPCSLDYPGDDAPKRRIARWMVRGAADRGLPRELPVMAGIGESGLRNLPGPSYFGYFSMHRRLNAGDLRGFPRRPELQLRWFLDTAVAVHQRRVAGGLPDPALDEEEFGLWIADVERPAPANRSLYQQYLDDARTLGLGVCSAPVATDTAAPAIRVRVPRRQRPLRRAGAVTARVRCPAEACMAGLTGSVPVKGRHATSGLRLLSRPRTPP